MNTIKKCDVSTVRTLQRKWDRENTIRQRRGLKKAIFSLGLRVCSDCQQVKHMDQDNFYRNKHRKGGFGYTCKPCSAMRSKSGVGREGRHEEARREHYEFIRDYLSSHPCVDCGISDRRVLSFRHIDPATKEYKVSGMVAMSLDRVRREVAKCDVLCFNCINIRRLKDIGSEKYYW
jgi:hypothetical protein